MAYAMTVFHASDPELIAQCNLKQQAKDKMLSTRKYNLKHFKD